MHFSGRKQKPSAHGKASTSDRLAPAPSGPGYDTDILGARDLILRRGPENNLLLALSLGLSPRSCDRTFDSPSFVEIVWTVKRHYAAEAFRRKWFNVELRLVSNIVRLTAAVDQAPTYAKPSPETS